MKKLFVIMALSATALAANAQQVRTFYWKEDGYWVKVDLAKKTFLADGCGTDTEKILNYKKSGNKESFTTSDGGRTYHHVFTKKSDTDYTYTKWYTPSETVEKSSVEVTTKAPSGSGGVTTGKTSASGNVAEKNPVKSVGNGVKGLFNKGKSLFKKDKGKTDTGSNAKAEKKPNTQPVDDGSMPEK